MRPNTEVLFYTKMALDKYDLQGNLVKEFVCKYDCIKQLKISDKTLAKALDKEILYNGNYFRTIGDKLKCL